MQLTDPAPAPPLAPQESILVMNYRLRCGGASMQIHAHPCGINLNPYKSMQIDYPVVCSSE
eukprot:7246800-Lingulodinium_polyedra.AAC.1